MPAITEDTPQAVIDQLKRRFAEAAEPNFMWGREVGDEIVARRLFPLGLEFRPSMLFERVGYGRRFGAGPIQEDRWVIPGILS